MALLNYGSGQYGAVTGGKKRRYPYEEMIYAAQPQIYAEKARKEDLAFRERQLASQTGFQEEQQDIAREQSKLREEQLGEAKKQARTGAYISGTGTAAMTTYLGYKAVGGKAMATGGKAAGSYAVPAAAGYVAGKYIGKPIGKDYIPTALVKGEKARGAWGGAAAGAGAGALYGSAVFPGIGTAAGAIVGGAAGYFGASGCIIITTATSPYSYEVDLARTFRDNFLGPITLRGYYMIADKIVPLMRKSALFKKVVKKHLIDHLIKYGEWVFGISKRQPYKSTAITKNFLKLCRFCGSLKSFYMRSNGEIL